MHCLIGVHAVILDEKNRLLVLKRAENDEHMPGKWDLPGGTVRFGESLDCALKRELREEIGNEADVISPVFTRTYVDDSTSTHVLQILFSCKLKTKNKIILNPDEHEAYLWATENELMTLSKISFLEAFLLNKEN